MSERAWEEKYRAYSPVLSKADNFETQIFLIFSYFDRLILVKSEFARKKVFSQR
jgi:hypothetical protein